jgi:Fur family peroxide stress response transcriptional regulator
MNAQRNTVQRQIILDTLTRLNTHPSIEELCAEIRKDHPAISKTTVYRNLRQLAKNGLIREVSLLDGLERYDSYTEQHYHFKCKSCGGIYDVEIDYVSGLNDAVHEKYSFQVDEHNIVFSGVCKKCGKTARSPYN